MNIKKIIAREGIILIIIILLGIFLASIPSIAILIINLINKVFATKSIFYNGHPWSIDEIISWGSGKPLYISIPENIGYTLLFLGYPTYLLIRFIIWAMRTLKAK